MSSLGHIGGALFGWVLQTTWQATVLAGLILAAQWLLRKRLSASWRYGLWLLLVVRLLMPGTPESAVSIFNLARTSPAQPVAVRTYESFSVAGPTWTVNSFNGTPSTNVDARPAVLAPLPLPPSVIVRPTTKINWLGIAFCGWLAGVCFFGARLVWTNGRFHSRIGGYQPIADEDVTRLFDECRAALKVTQPVRLIESEEVESPAVYGLWRKWLLLPDGAFERFSANELRCIFLHELAHIKRGDLGINWVVSVLQAVHWFNPALWLAFARMRADRELAADALALGHVWRTEKLAYGETILKVVENLARCAAQPGLVGIAEGKAGLKERLGAIAQFGAARPWRWAAVAVAVAVAGVGLTDARQPAARAVSATEGTLKRPEISGRVIGPDGRPVANAQVALFQRKSRPHMTGEYIDDSDLYLTGKPRLFNPASGHVMGETRLAPWNYCITDGKGRFYLDDLEGTLFLLAASEKGFVNVSTNEFSRDMTVKLEPWGRIEGTLWHYDEAVTNESVWAAPNDDGTGWSRSTKFETKTDSRGRFRFEYVPSGKFSVGGSGMVKSAIVKSGETAVVKIGGSGRPVIGKFKIRNPYVEIEWGRYGNYYFFGTYVPQPPKGLKSEEDIKTWSKRPEIARALEKFRMRPLQFGKDGSFRIDQVDPGAYDLSASIHDPRQASWSTNFIAEYEGTFEIPAGKPNSREPVDLGVIEVSLKPER